MEVESVLGSGPDDRPVVPVRYTPRVKKVFAFAAQEAVALGSRQVGPEHILLGLLRDGDGVAGRVLQGLGVNIEKVREEVCKGR
jgi:ATP-dependent Clp protease ATP-binding subunit ClpC